MDTSLTTPPRRPLPVPPTPLTPAQRREHQEAELRARYPDAAPWYGPRSRLWLAAPTGASRLLRASTATTLAAMLDDHYRHLIPPPSRPALPEHHRPGRSPGAVARNPQQPAPSRATTPTTPARPDAASSYAPAFPKPTRPRTVQGTSSRSAASYAPTLSSPARSGAAARAKAPRPGASRTSRRRGTRRQVPKGGWLRRGLIKLGLVAVTT